MPGGLFADGVVQGVGASHAASRQLSAPVHLHQRCRVHRGGHLRIDLLGLAQHSDDRIGVAQGAGHLHGVEHDLALGLKVRPYDHGRVGQKIELVEAGHVHDHGVADSCAVAQTGVAIQHGLEEDRGVEKSLQKDLRPTRGHNRYRGGGAARFASRVDQFECRQVKLRPVGKLLYFVRISNQDEMGQAQGMSLGHGF